MGRLEGKKPSPAMVVAIVALVFAVAGSAFAGVAAVSVLSKKEKKQTRNIAGSEVKKLAPGLSVGNAGSLGGTPRSGFYSAADVDARQPRAAETRSTGEVAFSSVSPVDRISVQLTAPRAGFAFVVASGNVHPSGTIAAGHQCAVQISVPQIPQAGRIASFTAGDTNLEYRSLVNSWIVPVNAGVNTFTLHLSINTNVSTSCTDGFSSSSSSLNAIWLSAVG